MSKPLAFIFFAVGICLLAYIAYANSSFKDATRTFSNYTLLTSSWEDYKKDYLNQDGRILDHTQNDMTTSEGQSYAMLRAVWIDDKPTFDKVWQWTKDNLDRPNDALFSWKWGQKSDGSYGTLANGGDNAASDADQDIALALILASRRWNNPSYLNQAKPIINDIWQHETAPANGQRYLIAGNWAQDSQTIIINPSYFAPYAWQEFAQYDSDHDWPSLIAHAYQLLTQATQDHLDQSKSGQLPPDWVSLDRVTGQLSATKLDGLTTNYAYDALRIPWRITLDYQWFNRPQAKNYLEQSFGPLVEQYKTTGSLSAMYAHDGAPLNQAENASMYATFLFVLDQHDPELATQLYQQKILRTYSNSTNSFNHELPYYEQNWLWFTEGLYQHKLSRFAS